MPAPYRPGMGQLISLSEWRTSMGGRGGVPALIERESGASLHCTLVGMSRQGACVSAPATALPNVFVLKIAGARRHVCEVLWRKGYTVGVRFIGIDQLLRRTARASTKLKQSCARASANRIAVVEEAG